MITAALYSTLYTPRGQGGAAQTARGSDLRRSVYIYGGADFSSDSAVMITGVPKIASYVVYPQGRLESPATLTKLQPHRRRPPGQASHRADGSSTTEVGIEMRRHGGHGRSRRAIRV